MIRHYYADKWATSNFHWSEPVPIQPPPRQFPALILQPGRTKDPPFCNGLLIPTMDKQDWKPWNDCIRFCSNVWFLKCSLVALQYLTQVTYMGSMFSAVFPRRFPWKSAKTSVARPQTFCVLPVRTLEKALGWFQTMLGNSFRFWRERHSLSKTKLNFNLTFETKSRLRQTVSLNASKIERISQQP